ncbi:hypothetical protein A6C57_28190 (plasmid) [Fibrella sp. ES10-3-2-2]
MTSNILKLMETAQILDPTTFKPVTGLKSWQTIDQTHGDIISRYKYLEGHPRNYRFDAKEGVFSINGTEKLGRSLTFQPIAWRIFNDSILGQPAKQWAELFFIDERKCVSNILFHGYSVDNIFRLIEPLYYDDRTLANVILTATAERKENTKIQPKGVYYIAQFRYELADADLTRQRQEFATDNRIFRHDTLTDPARFKTAHCYGFTANSQQPTAQLQ